MAKLKVDEKRFPQSGKIKLAQVRQQGRRAQGRGHPYRRRARRRGDEDTRLRKAATAREDEFFRGKRKKPPRDSRQALRANPRGRPDRLRQDDDPPFGPRLSKQPGQKDMDRRGPGRDNPVWPKAGSSQPEHKARTL